MLPVWEDTTNVCALDVVRVFSAKDNCAVQEAVRSWVSDCCQAQPWSSVHVVLAELDELLSYSKSLIHLILNLPLIYAHLRGPLRELLLLLRWSRLVD